MVAQRTRFGLPCVGLACLAGVRCVGGETTSEAAVDALLRDLNNATLGAPGAAAAGVVAALLGGLADAGLLERGEYDPCNRRADLHIAGGAGAGGEATQLRDVFWIEMRIAGEFSVSWELLPHGAVDVRFSGLSGGPLPGAHKTYREVGLDAWSCSGEDHYSCHLDKALLLERLWEEDRGVFAPGPRRLLSPVGDSPTMMWVARQLGHGFGWGMLTVLSTPPMSMDAFRFSLQGVTGVEVVGSKSPITQGEEASLALRHDFEEMNYQLCHHILGFGPLGSLVRNIGVQVAPVAVNFVVLMTASLPRWDGLGQIRGADAGAMVSLFKGMDWRRRAGKYAPEHVSSAVQLPGQAFVVWPGGALERPLLPRAAAIPLSLVVFVLVLSLKAFPLL